MIDKKQAATKTKPVHTIRCGEVTASIFQRQSLSTGTTPWDAPGEAPGAGKSRMALPSSASTRRTLPE
jgi:hypothetical protein